MTVYLKNNFLTMMLILPVFGFQLSSYASNCEPDSLQTFQYAVNIALHWNSANISNQDLENDITLLLSSYSFDIKKNDLKCYSISTLELLVDLICLLKTNEDLLSDSFFHERRMLYLSLENEAKSILDKNDSERWDLVNPIIKKQILEMRNNEPDKK